MKDSLKILIGAVILGIIIPVELFLFNTVMHRYASTLASMASPTVQWIVVAIITAALTLAGIKLVYDGVRG